MPRAAFETPRPFRPPAPTPQAQPLGAIALQEATLVLATIMRRFHLRLAPGSAVWPLQRVTLRPRGGLPMRIAARRPDRAAAEPARESRVHAG